MSAEILRRAADAMRNDALSMEANSMPADAAWHPDVALAVADLLEDVAFRWDFSVLAPNGAARSLAVARAYLGES